MGGGTDRDGEGRERGIEIEGEEEEEGDIMIYKNIFSYIYI